MGYNKLTQARAAFGALLVGSTSGNPGRGVNGAGPPLSLSFPSNVSPSVIHAFRRASVDMSASGLWAASVATATSAIQPIPFVGAFAGDHVDITPLIAPLTGVTERAYVANAFDLTAVATSTAYIANQVVAVQTVATYTRTSPVLVNGACIVLDTKAVRGDLGAHVTGTHIPANTTVVEVSPGVGFVMNKAATGATSGSVSFLPFSALACITAGTSAASAPTYTTIPNVGQTLTDGTAVWENIGSGCPAIQWTNATGSTITTGTGLLGAYSVFLTGFRS